MDSSACYELLNPLVIFHIAENHKPEKQMTKQAIQNRIGEYNSALNEAKVQKAAALATAESFYSQHRQVFEKGIKGPELEALCDQSNNLFMEVSDFDQSISEIQDDLWELEERLRYL